MEKQAEKREDELREKVEEMDREISQTARTQIEHGTKIETLIGFHREIKGLLKTGVFSMLGVSATIIGALIMLIYKTMQKGIP